jgi:hypothetical protein
MVYLGCVLLVEGHYLLELVCLCVILNLCVLQKKIMIPRCMRGNMGRCVIRLITCSSVTCLTNVVSIMPGSCRSSDLELV